MGARTGCRRVPSARQVRGASGARANVRRRGAPSALEPGPGPFLSSVGRAQFVHCSWSTHHEPKVFFFSEATAASEPPVWSRRRQRRTRGGTGVPRGAGEGQRAHEGAARLAQGRVALRGQRPMQPRVRPTVEA